MILIIILWVCKEFICSKEISAEDFRVLKWNLQFSFYSTTHNPELLQADSRFGLYQTSFIFHANSQLFSP